MAYLCRNQILRLRNTCNQFYRMKLKIPDQWNGSRNCSNHSMWSNSIRNCRSLSCLSDQYSVFASWKFRSYAKKIGDGGRKSKGSKGKASLSDEEMMEVVDVNEYRNDLQAVINKLKADYVAHLSLRTSAGSIESLIVKIDNEDFPLNELAQISRKNPNLIAINMSGFPEGLKPAIHAITDSGLGLNPQQEGTMIYLAVPKVTREFREKLAKNAKTLFMKAKDDIRNVQNNFIKKAKQQTELSEDLVFSATQQLTTIAEEFASEAEKMMKTKQKDLLGNS